MSWFSNAIRGKNPMTRGADGPMVRPPASGPSGSTPGQVYPVGSHASGGNIQNTGGVSPTGVNNQMTTPSGGTGGDAGGEDVPWWKRAGEFAIDHAGDIIAVGAGAGAAYEGYQNSQMANQLMHEGIDMAKQDYASRGQFRDAAAPMMLDPRTPDLSGLFANSGNPYAKGRQIPVVGSRANGPFSPMVLGQSATEEQARQGYENIQGAIRGGQGLHGILNAAQQAVAPPQVLGKPATEEQANQAISNVQDIVRTGRGNPSQLIRAVGRGR